MSLTSRSIYWLILSFIVIKLAVLVFLTFGFTTDDAYITLRYAQNWVEGIGIVWNQTDPPVEGYSNFFYVLLSALFAKLHLPLVLSIKLVGITALLMSVFLIYRLARFWFPPLLALAAPLLLLLFPGQFWWAVSGLETITYQALIIAAFICFFYGLGYQCNQTGTAYWVQKAPIENSLTIIWFALSCFLFLLIALTRFDGIVFIPLILFSILVLRPKLANGFIVLLLLLVPYGLYLYWKWQYYGSLLPNSVYCKSFYFAMEGDNTQTLAVLMELWVSSWPLIFFAVFAFLRFFDKPYYDWRLLLLGVTIALFVVGYFRAHPVVAYYIRFFLPILPFIILLAIAGIVSLLTISMPNKSEQWKINGILITVLLFSLIQWPFLSQKLSAQETKFELVQDVRHQLAYWLRDNIAQSDYYAIGDSGIIPFYAGGRAIDLYCLNSYAYTSESVRGDSAEFFNRLFHLQPKYIILTSATDDRFTPHYSGDLHLLAEESRFLAQYTLKKQFNIPEYDYNYFVFRRINHSLSSNKHLD